MKKAEYKIIKTEKELHAFLNEFDCFHDSCIKEIHYISGGYVKPNLRMYPINDKRTLSVVFQRQDKDNSVIELIFEELVYMQLIPRGLNSDCIILQADLWAEEGLFIWDEWGVRDQNRSEGTRVAARKLKWRTLENGLGSAQIYSMRDFSED